MIDTICLWTGRISLGGSLLFALLCAVKYLRIRVAEARRLQMLRERVRERMVEMSQPRRSDRIWSNVPPAPMDEDEHITHLGAA